MIRVFALLLAVTVLAAGIVLSGLVTNWFRYELPLQGIFVIVATWLSVLIVASVAYVTYTKNSNGLLGVSAVITVVLVIFVLFVYRSAIGGFPGFYLAHIERGPSAILQAQHGSITYWIELRNPFASQHAEFLVLAMESGKEQRIPIHIFSGPSSGYMSATQPSDWATLSSTSDPNVVTLTLGPSLNQSDRRYRIDLLNKTAKPLHTPDTSAHP